MKLVLDASAAIAGVLGRHQMTPLILDALADASVVIAPDLFASEITSGMWKYVIAGQLSIDDAIERLDAALRLVDRYEPVSRLASEVLREASAHRHSVYDLSYVILARREGAAILTIDTRLRKIAATMGVPVRL